MALLKINKCGDCGKRIVVMSTSSNSILPVEVEDGKEYDDMDTFDSQVHTSHLLHCIKLRHRWEGIKKKEFNKRAALLKIGTTDLLR